MNAVGGTESSGRIRFGLRREISILLPLAMLVVIGLSLFSLFLYRSSLTLLGAERRAEAERLARAAAGAWVPDSSPARWRSLAPHALGIALVDANGAVIAQTGEVLPAPLPEELGAAASGATGPTGPLVDRVAGYARVPGATVRYLRVDLPASVLAAQRRTLAVLFPVVLLASAGALVLVVLFARHVFAPYDALLARARAAGAVEGPPGDEIATLLTTFERALAALAKPPGSAEDDIAALERALAPSLESGLLLLDREARVIALNPTGAQILGAPPPPAGTPLDNAFPTVPQIAAALSPAIARGAGAQRQEVEIDRRGQPLSLGFTLHPLRRDDGSVRGFLALFADLTEARQKEAESRVASSLAQLGELTAGLAHELRNSLATLRGYLTLIDRQPGEERIADYLGEIRRETDHLQRVLEDFLSFARPGSTRLETIDLAALARRAADDPSLAGERIEIESDSGLPKLQADPQLLERAVRNLLHNAVEATHAAPPGQPVTVRIRELPSGEIEMVVADRGAGLSAEVRERLFQPFATGRADGVGLGLALTHRIVTLHRGRILLREREGGGTEAVLAFPKTVVA